MEKLSESDQKLLVSNRFVEKITNSHVSFTPEFKILAVEQNLDGKSPIDIFRDAGLDISLFHAEFPKKSVSRWKKIYLKEGKAALKSENRGKGATGRPKKSYDPEDLDSMRERLAYLEMENAFLKKLHALVDSKEKRSLK